MSDRDLTFNDKGYAVWTDNGWQPFAGVASMGKHEIYVVAFNNGAIVKCSSGHGFIDDGGCAIRADQLQPGWKVQSDRDGIVECVASYKTDQSETTFSLIDVGGGHRYFTNGILSANCEFVTDDETLINPLTLSRLKSKEPIYYTGTVRWFKDPEPGKVYMAALDPSLGTGGDYAAIEVFELPGMVQVAEWQHNKTVTRGQVRILMQILVYIDAVVRDQGGDPEIYWTVENNTLGESVLNIIEDTGEDRFPGMFLSERKRKGQNRRFRKGFNTDNRKKLSACARLKSLVESDRMTINSAQLLKELKTFVSKETSFSAKPGTYDDLVASSLLVVRMLEVVAMMGADVGDIREHISDTDIYGEEMVMVV